MKLLVFDMGHVFIDFEWMAVCEGFCNHAGISFTDFKPILKHLASLGYERGEISTKNFVRELSDKLNKPLTIDEFSRIWNLTFRENLEMATLLGNLKAHCPLYLLSNTNENHYSFLQSNFNVARHFEELILSYEIGAQKPEHKIYAEVLKRSGLPGTEIAFFDDLVTNIEAAKSAGIENSFLFTGIHDLKKDLQILGVNF